MMYENSFNSTDEAIAKRKELQNQRDEADRLRKEKAAIKKARDSHVDNVVYTIHHNKESGHSDDIIAKYNITYYELVAGLKRVYKINSWGAYLKKFKANEKATELFKFRTLTVPTGKVIARSEKFKHKYAVITKEGHIFMVNEGTLTIKKRRFNSDSNGSQTVSIYLGHKLIVANIMWATFKNKNIPKHTIIGYKDNDKTNLDITNLYVQRQGLKGDK